MLHRKMLIMCLVCVLGIVILYHWWLVLTSSHIIPGSGDNTLTALNVLNTRHSDASWNLTFSYESLWRHSHTHDDKKEINLTVFNDVHHNHYSTHNEDSTIQYKRNERTYMHTSSRKLSADVTLTDVKRQISGSELLSNKIDHLKADNSYNSMSFVRQTLRQLCKNSSASGLVNVVAISLYGSELRYTVGAVRNAYLIRQNFPDWQLWVFIESPMSSKYPAVPEDVVSQLVSLGAQVRYISPEDDFIPPMMWRFLVADDPAVDWFIVRDADSRLTQRDAAAVAASIQSEHIFHCVRDHPSHAAYALSGGLWGGRAPLIRLVLRKSWAAMMRGVAAGYLNDMNFLNSVIWPRVERYAYCLDSVSCDRWTNSFPFPTARHSYEHVGQVYDEHDTARHNDVQILRHSLENRNCIPL